MKTHTSAFKENVKLFGRELDSKIKYTIDGVDYELGAEQLNSVTPHYEGAILKSVMKQLDIDSNAEIPLGTILNYQFGVKVNNEYDYIDFGNYVVYSNEKQEDTNSYKITCYDKMLYSMIDYEQMDITYPISIRDYINAICTKLGLTFTNINDEFANYSKEINNELYLSYNDTTHTYSDSMGYTFRDVLDELAQVTASTICINDNDELEIRYINDTEDTIDEEYLKDVNVNFGEKYGPINSIVLTRAGSSDSIYKKDEESIETNGLCEIKIEDNQIMNFNDRADYLPDILNKLDGLEYYLNDFSSTGITYYNLCDRYNVQIGDNTYSCIMFNDEINITQGLEENIYTELPEESETDYTKADKTDRKINQTYIIVDKQNQTIENVVNNVTEQNDKISKITQTVDQIEQQITDIPTITTENSGTGSVFLYNLANAKLINLRIHPTDRDILGLFASPLLKVANGLKTLSRGVTFDNDGNDEDVYYKLPDNLYFYNNEIYDEFFYDGSEEKIYVIRKVRVDEEGNKYALDTPVQEDYEYEDIVVTEGDYNVFMSTYPTAYIYVKAMIKNDYTSQFATKLELTSSINQEANRVNIALSEKLDDEEFTGANIMLAINNDESEAVISADKVNLNGFVTITDLAETGATTINGSNITTGTINGILIEGTTIKGSEFTGDTENIKLQIGTDSDGYMASDNSLELITKDDFKALGIYLKRFATGQNVTYFKSDGDAFYFLGDLTVSGTKNRVVEINNGSKVLLNAYETATPYFGDIGNNITDKNGYCKIKIEDIFSQTIELENYKVFIQECSDGHLYVKKYTDFFEVIGTPNTEFDWEIKAIQKGYKNTRLKVFK